MKPKSRRSAHVSGLVRFPVDDPRWVDTHEGGMAVYLLFEEDPAICIAGVGCFVYADCPQGGLGEGARAAFCVTTDPEKDQERDRVFWLSGQHATGLLYLGSTGASLYSEAAGGYWLATEEDLTDEGKLLYTQLHMLYGGGPPKIMTVLDT